MLRENKYIDKRTDEQWNTGNEFLLLRNVMEGKRMGGVCVLFKLNIIANES